MPAIRRLAILLVVSLLVSFAFSATADSAPAAGGDGAEKVVLRAWGVPNNIKSGPIAEAERRVLDRFRQRYPWIDPVGTSGLTIPGGSRTMDMVPFMQTAGDTGPHVYRVNFRQSQTYIDMKLLYPLDEYVEKLAEVEIADGSSLDEAAYVRALRAGPGWPLIEARVPSQCWPVMRRLCPYAADCPYRAAKGLAPLESHHHVWTFPVRPQVVGLQYDRTMFAEHAAEGVEQRAPRTWDEMLAWAKACTDPAANEFGLKLIAGAPAWNFTNLLYAAGGQAITRGDDGRWVCTLDTEEALETAWFFARLRLEKVQRDGRFISRGVVRAGSETATGEVRFAMSFEYLGDRFLQAAVDQTKGIGPVPVGPTGRRGSEFNSAMFGIFSGLARDERTRDAAWNYTLFFDGPEARRIRTEKLVEAGLGPFVRRHLLEEFNDNGRYDSVIRRVPEELEQTYRIAAEHGIPEPYGRNCQGIYGEMQKPIGAIWNSASIRDAIDRGDAAAAKAEIRGILRRATDRINRKVFGHLAPAEQRRHNAVSWVVIAAVLVIFVFMLRQVFKAFTPEHATGGGRWRFGRYRKAYLLAAPALLLIAMWMYWPMIRGTSIAFQDYSVLGDSEWIGARNFATVLFDPEFWYSLRVTFVYGLLFFIFGFWVPIALALLLNEVPRGKLLFRSIYYVPAVLSGVVVIFLWKSFYLPDGMINRLINLGVDGLNLLPGVALNHSYENWLENPAFALFFCLLPTVWAGMGPGCLIYLAALKTIPEELYESADIDGAGIRAKLFSIAVPSIKVLIMINFIGAMIGAIRGSGGFILAMTGGGPYGELGGATEVIGLRIFYTTFGQLKFGVGAAMAWVLGAMLVGFTVIQLKRMSNIEFRTAGSG